MSISFDHTTVIAKNSSDSAAFFRELFALPEAPSWGPFVNVQLTDGTLVQFAEPPSMTFSSSTTHFEHWADPRMTEPGTVNTGHGGRGVYFRDPTGHFFEMLTHSYLTPRVSRYRSGCC
ncbi:VOC family protein [Rhodococcus sp. 06-235-1A]|uniref:VOC family protein n=1 Tax=Rhodococcus sp. 06-235-1A TaxID=2022508 RepID=UPI001179C84B|nr:VOC family protein [Rhodococcus sp. 06-235-1A]